MALIPLGGPLYFPPMPPCPSSSGALLVGSNITASAHKIATIIRPPRSGMVDWFAPSIGRGGLGLTADVRFSFQDLSAGFPDAGADQFRTVVNPALALTVGLYEPGLMTSDGTDTGTRRTLDANIPIACVIDFSAWTSGQVAWKAMGSFSFGGPVRTYLARNTAGTWAPVLSSQPGLLGLKYTDLAAYVPCTPWIYPVDNANSINKGRTLNTGTTPDEYGNRVVPPTGLRVAGAWGWIDAAGDYEFVLLGPTGNVLASIPVLAANRAATFYRLDEVPLARTDIASGDVTRVVCKPTTGTSITVAAFTVASAAHMTGVDGGMDAYATHRTDGGAFTDVATERAAVGLILDAF